MSQTKELDENRLIDYAEDGTPVGVDLLSVSAGVEVEDLPEEGKVAEVLEHLGIKVFA